jgi:hypothetical protein
MTPVICLLLLGVGPPDARACAEAVIAASAAYERSIHALHWSQRLFLPPSVHGTTARSEWVMDRQEERYADENWAWLLSSRADPGASPDPEVEYQRFYMGTAGLRVTAGLTFRRGMLALNDGYFIGGVHLWRHLGRGLDYSMHTACRSLEDLLRRADRIEYVEPTDELPWPGVRARTADPARHFMDLEVRVDPACGGMPRSIISRRADGWPAEQMAVIAAQAFDQIRIPVVGMHTIFYTAVVADAVDPVPEQRRLDLERARSGLGLPAELNTPTLRQWIQRFTQVCLIDPQRGHWLAPLTIKEQDLLAVPQIFVIDHAEVNTPMSFDQMFEHLPAEIKMFNGCTGEWTDADGIRRFWKGLHP